MAEVGTLSVGIALAAAVWAVVTSWLGYRRSHGRLVRSAETALRASFLSLTLGSGVLVWLFVTRDFSVRYVAEYSDSALPLAYTVAAFWAGQNGSLLLWAWLLAGTATLVIRHHRDRHRELMPIVVLVMALLLVLFVALVLTVSNPFTRLPFTPQDGAGLNPMLQNWGQLYHPPATFLGYVGFSVPFAFSIAALVTGRLDTTWIRAVRGWTLGSWLFLGLGILLGARWAYTELGWGGYWAWDPVENVSLLPWLTATAYLHSAVLQERRGTLRVWNLVLAITTFVLTLFGTFLVRSGVAASVHAFAESSAGLYLLGAIVTVVIASALLILWRLPLLRSPGPSTEGAPHGWSRERLFLLTNALLIAYTLAILWGTLFPVIASTLRGQDVTVGEPFFDRMTVPFTVGMLLLLGLCPVVAWRRASSRSTPRQLRLPVATGLLVGTVAAVLDRARNPLTTVVLTLSAFALATLVLELHRGLRAHHPAGARPHPRDVRHLFARSPRRYGGLVAHLGIVLLIAGVALDVTYRSEEQLTLAVGEQAPVGAYVLTLERIDTQATATRVSIAATLQIARSSGGSVGSVVAERYVGAGQEQPRTRVGVRSLLREDLYVILGDVDVESQTAGFHVHLHPGILWLWLGGGLLLLGGTLALWPYRRPEPVGDVEDLEAAIAARREQMLARQETDP
jgi:cytochrome c-type biogenesis protein CcmF